MKSKCGRREIDNNKHTILKYGEGGSCKICGADMKYELHNVIALGYDNLQLQEELHFLVCAL